MPGTVTTRPTIEIYPGAQSVSRALALLKCFDDAHPEWTLGDLALRVGLNKATAHRLLAALESEGFLMRAGGAGGTGGSYRLGPELIALGGSAMRSNDLRSVSRPELEALAAATGETTTLEVLSGSEVVILDEVGSRHVLGLSQDVGARLPAHATSTGKMLLAFAPEAVIVAALRLPLRRLADCTVTSAHALRDEFVAIRAQGYTITLDELENGFAAIAAPIVDYAGNVVASVSVGGPAARLSGPALDSVLHLTKEAAQRISQQLGYRP